MPQWIPAAEEGEPPDEISMLFVGDSVDRSTIWDVNMTAQGGGVEVDMLIDEHWRTALSMPNLEMVSLSAYHSVPMSRRNSV